MKPSQYITEVNNTLKESKELLSNWIKASKANQISTQHYLDKKKARTILKKCEGLYLIASAENLNASDSILEKVFKQYENLIDKALVPLS